ncbi:hypothetical protein [Corynebacterium gerontici]|uniref:ABC-2 family transporter protein n=1 Tax=Corynebacterium gerontici TaxID=2079234 RepID=A0A3G6J279_9CORY|nr:hypothetical protein [Corynebacterium gerontici]AZA12165.1 ABC-2 family transporter protein [Corynebacterium gerontici]
MNALKSELTKLLTLRSTWITFVVAILILQIPVVVLSFTVTEPMALDFEGLLLAEMLYVFIMAYFGASIGRDLQFKLNAQAMLTQKSRSSWIFARVFWQNFFALAGLILAVLLGAALATILPNLSVEFTNFQDLGATALKSVVLLNLGIGFAMLTRSTAAGMAIPLAQALVLDNLLVLASTKVSALKYLLFMSPTLRAGQLGYDNGAPRGFGVDQFQPDWFNALVLCAWLVLMVLLAVWSNKRDVR